MNRHTANIAIKPVATVNKTSPRGLRPHSEAVGNPDAKATPGLGFGVSLCSLVDGAEMRLILRFCFGRFRS